MLRVSKVAAPNRAVSGSENVMTCSNIAPRRSRPKPVPVRVPKYITPIEHSTCSPVTPSITTPSRTIVVVSPFATPSSMMVALTVGRYNDARVLISCSAISTATSRRYGRMYWRNSADSIG